MKQIVIKNHRRKAVITRFSRPDKNGFKYYVAYFNRSEDLSTTDTYGFKKLKDAKYSAECHLI